MFVSRQLLLLTALAVGWLTLAGVAPAAARAPQSYSQLRVVHAQADVSAVDVLVDGALAIAALGFGRDSGYLPLPSGPHTVALVPSGTSLEATPGQELRMVPGHLYTVVALAAPAAPLALDDESLAPVGGPALIRLVHATPAAPPLVLTVADAATSPVAYGEASPYADAPGGTRPLVVRQVGSDAMLTSIPDATLALDRAYTFIAVGGGSGASAVSLLPLLDSTAPGMPTVYRPPGLASGEPRRTE